MPEQTRTYHTVTPYLVVPDADWEMNFVKAAFGATEVACHRNDAQIIMHAELSVGDSLIMVGQANDSAKALPAALHLWMPEVDAVYARALQAGATALSPPADKPYGHRDAGVVNRNGVQWWIGWPADNPPGR